MAFSCPSPEALEELQLVSNYRLVRKKLRSRAIGSLFFGALALKMGLAGLRVSLLNAVLAMIGVLLLADGAWLFVSPTPGLMILDGCAFITVGLWNIFVVIYAMAVARGGPEQVRHFFFAGLGIAQIAWGCRSFRRYARFRLMPQREPSPDLIKRIDEIVKEINKAKPKTDPDLIEFESQTFVAKQDWKGRLAPEFATFVDHAGQDVIFAKREDVTFAPRGKVRPKKAATGSLVVGDRTFKATLPAVTVERYQAWKEGAAPLADGEAVV